MLAALLLACTCGSAPVSTPPGEADAAHYANVAPAIVTEALAGDGRSYLHIKEASYDFWASVPAIEAKAGDHVLLGTGPLRERVHSADLERDFDVLTEIALVKLGDPEGITVAPPPGGLPIEAIYARKAELAGKAVKVRGRVVKANKAIFGKNWYHLQDGTGTEGANDLTVTTLAEANLGDVLIAEAPLTLDRDFGFGYFFAVILEDAVVTVEGTSTQPAEATAAVPDATAPDPATAPADPATTPALPGAPATALTPLVPQPRTEGLPKAPSRTVFGLEIGTLDDAGLQAWATSRKLTCTAQAAARRATLRTECHAGLDTTTFPERKSAGKFTQFLLSRTEAGPFHYLSLARRYSIPTHAGEEFETTVATLRAQFGEPTQLRPFDKAKLSAKILRFSATWNFADLDVSLSMFRAGTDYITITETWSVPGIEAAVGARPGTTGHGGMKGKPAGWNPHVEDHPGK